MIPTSRSSYAVTVAVTAGDSWVSNIGAENLCSGRRGFKPRLSERMEPRLEVLDCSLIVHKKKKLLSQCMRQFNANSEPPTDGRRKPCFCMGQKPPVTVTDKTLAPEREKVLVGAVANGEAK